MKLRLNVSSSSQVNREPHGALVTRTPDWRPRTSSSVLSVRHNAVRGIWTAVCRDRVFKNARKASQSRRVQKSLQQRWSTYACYAPPNPKTPSWSHDVLRKKIQSDLRYECATNAISLLVHSYDENVRVNATIKDSQHNKIKEINKKKKKITKENILERQFNSTKIDG